MAKISFNLVDEPWITCTKLDGGIEQLGFRDVLMKSHKIQSIQSQNPLTEAALLRVLLAAVHRAVDGPRSSNHWKELYIAGRFDQRIPQYLDKWQHRFDLFSKDAPFYQTPELLVIDEAGHPSPQPVSALMLELASGNNKTLFDHTTDDAVIKLSPAQAANAIITAQMFSLGGLNRKTTNLFGYQQSFFHSVMVNGIFIALSGRTLFETLMLNMLIYGDVEPIPNTPADCPVWERTDRGGTTATTPKGYLDYLTCKCRHLLLLPESENGEIFVEHMHIAQGEAFPDVVNPGSISRKNKEGKWYHPQLKVDQLVWRDSTSLFAFDERDDKRPKAFRQVQSMKSIVSLPQRYICTAYALANNKANPLLWRRERLNVPLSLLSDSNTVAYLEKAMELVNKAASILNKAVWTFMKEYLPDESKDTSEKTLATGVSQTFWDNMEGYFHQFLFDLDDPEKALDAWENAIKKIARESLETCLDGKYRGSARSYRAWSIASGLLNALLTNLHD